MAGRKGRTRLEIERDRARVADLYLTGKTQHEIGQALGFSRSQIAYDLAQIQKSWRESAIRDLDEAKAQELAKIDRLERTYWDAWERSVGTAKTETIKGRGTDKPQSVEKTIRTEDLNGDPRYLQGVMACIERRCKLLGIDAPEKKDITSGGQPITRIEIVPPADGGEG